MVDCEMKSIEGGWNDSVEKEDRVHMDPRLYFAPKKKKKTYFIHVVHLHPRLPNKIKRVRQCNKQTF